MPRSISTLAPLAMFAALATACGSNGQQALGQTGEPIINGQPSTSDQDYAVGIAILDSSGQLMAACSGSLVAENLVLTARHCVSQIVNESAGVACTQQGTAIGAGGAVGADYKPTQLAIMMGATIQFSNGYTPKFAAKGQQIFHTAVNNLCDNDIALILLDQKIAGAKLAKLRLSSPPVQGELITAIGWGVANNTTSQMPERRYRADIPVVKVGPASLGAYGGMGPNEFEIGEGICSGDSGGPAVAQSTGAVIGVVSRGGNGDPNANPNDPSTQCVNTQSGGISYTAFNFYTRVDGFSDLLSTAFAAAGTDPWLEGGPDPRLSKFGDGCTDSSQCQSNVCIGVGTVSQCSQTCDGSTPCPTGYSCVTSGSQQVCAPTNALSTTSSGGCAVSPQSGGRGALGFGIGLLGLALVGVARRRR